MHINEGFVTQFSCAAFSAESEPVIKNVIYMIPDGGGFALLTLQMLSKNRADLYRGIKTETPYLFRWWTGRQESGFESEITYAGDFASHKPFHTTGRSVWCSERGLRIPAISAQGEQKDSGRNIADGYWV